ncbi:MAG: hypothetical protein WEG36_08565 [Gemmatimonadota bacterium]
MQFGARILRQAGPRVALSLVALLALPQIAAGQGGLRLLPQVGLYTPLTDLTEVTDGGENLFEAGKKSSTVGLGLALELGSLRAQVNYATASDVPISGVGCESCDARSTLLTATVGLVLHPLPRILFFRPNLLVGAGVKRYDFDPGQLTDDGDWSSVLEDQTRFAGQLGVGLEFDLLGLEPQLELSAYLSRFEPGEGPEGAEESDLQTDLFLMLAIPLGG